MKNVLIISYYFPPSGGPGVQRILKFVKYLRDFDWEPVVLTVEKGAFPNIDESLLAGIPSQTEIIRTQTLNPFGVYAKFSGVEKDKAASVGMLSEQKTPVREKTARWIRANIFIPDARIGWYPYAVRAARRYINDNRIDAILSSGPPHSAHLIALKLHKKTKIPWIADFRDPWTDISFFNELPMLGVVKNMHSRLEKKILKKATAVTTVSPSWKNLFESKVKNRYTVIYNGYDEDDFDSITSAKSNNFIISHIGNLYGSRNPEKFWDALHTLIFEKKLQNIEVQLIGNVDASIREAISKRSLDEFVSIIPYLQYKEGLIRMRKSSLLLLVIEPWHAASGMIPGKLYEYLASHRPILGIGPPDGDAAHILKECNAGEMIDWKNDSNMIEFIHHSYRMWEEHSINKDQDNSTIQFYSRKNQTSKLAELLDSIYEQTKEIPAKTT